MLIGAADMPSPPVDAKKRRTPSVTRCRLLVVCGSGPMGRSSAMTPWSAVAGIPAIRGPLRCLNGMPTPYVGALGEGGEGLDVLVEEADRFLSTLHLQLPQDPRDVGPDRH